MRPETTSHRLSRRAFALGTAITSLVAGLAARGAGAQDATPTPTTHGIVGAWRTDATLAGIPGSRPTLLTFGADGTVGGAQPPTMPGFPGMGPVIFLSGVSGAWSADGASGAAYTFAMLTTDQAGAILGQFTIRGNAEVGPDGGTFAGTYTATLTDPAGAVLPLGTGTISGTLIVVEPMEMGEAGTPVATGTPAS